MSTEKDFTGLKLLVVDDSPINHRVVTMSLRGRFHEIDSAYNGLEAFEKYKKIPYDIILMDAQMPVMNGCESTLIIRMFEQENQLDQKSFIVAMTASDGDSTINECLQVGMDAYIGKPFVVSAFLRLVEEKFNSLS